MRGWLGAAGAVGVAVALAGPALADPRLDEKVYSPYVLNHVGEFEARTASLAGGPGGGETATVYELEYGLNDRVSLALVGAQQREAGESGRFTNLGVESVIYLGQIPHTGTDVGLYLEYGKGLHGETDFAEGKLLFARTSGRFEGLANLIVERPLGGGNSEHFASWGYAASATWRVKGRLRLGAEALGDFGDDHRFLGRQSAWVGPQVKWEWRPKGSPVELELDAGWLKSFGPDRNSADSQFRLGLELERRF